MTGHDDWLDTLADDIGIDDCAPPPWGMVEIDAVEAGMIAETVGCALDAELDRLCGIIGATVLSAGGRTAEDAAAAWSELVRVDARVSHMSEIEGGVEALVHVRGQPSVRVIDCGSRVTVMSPIPRADAVEAAILAIRATGVETVRINAADSALGDLAVHYALVHGLRVTGAGDLTDASKVASFHAAAIMSGADPYEAVLAGCRRMGWSMEKSSAWASMTEGCIETDTGLGAPPKTSRKVA